MSVAQAHTIHDSADPGTYTLRQVSRLFDLPEQRLRYWSQTGFVRPSAREADRVVYSFRDLIAIKVAKDLLDAGLPLRRVRRSLDALRMGLPDQDASLSRLRIRCDQDRVVVEDRDRTFDANTGQLLLDFRVQNLSDQMAEVLALPWVHTSEGPPGRTAYEWYLQGCREDGSSPEHARRAYEHAVDLDPDLGPAWTNLGGLRAEAGELDGARDAFAEALRCDPDQPEAQSNLAELALRAGEPDIAIAGYRQVLRHHPEHDEAHYGLARALLAVGGKSQALAHLERFCRAKQTASTEDARLQDRIVRAEETIARLHIELRRT